MSGGGRTLLSRPRTRIYDANYNIGENYYRPALERLDRKYSGRPLSPVRSSPSLARDLLDRHERAFADEDLSTSRRRAGKHISESNLFDSRGARISQRALDFIESNGIDEETASSLQRIRANKKVSVIDDVDLESTVNNITSRRLLDRSDKALRTVGLEETSRDNSRRGLDENISIKKRSLKVSYEDDGAGDLVKWSPVKRNLEQRESRAESRAESRGESSAALRARQSRDRLQDIEDEMVAMAEKQAARERRAARLKALVAESTEETEAAQSAIQAVSLRSRRQQQQVNED